ncbi:hypothetical protein QC762_0027190 [Podospora pseudocomata]|uniref:Uncharacterized protein n=1 Tax=Podospora pseudocomata TaxID=2093779 RepID=A0ABR0GRQ4_9PEZI|nr:hypothetical protein QC762_0027190 [Podospora pseudocomata]
MEPAGHNKLKTRHWFFLLEEPCCITIGNGFVEVPKILAPNPKGALRSPQGQPRTQWLPLNATSSD